MRALKYLFSTILKVFSKSKKLRIFTLILAISFLLIIALLCGIGALFTALGNTQNNSLPSEETQISQNNEDGQTNTARSTKELGYTGQDAEIVDVLRSHTWVGHGTTVCFSGETLELRNTSVSTHAWSASDAHQSAERHIAANENPNVIERDYVLVLSIDSKPCVATLTQSTIGAAIDWHLSCSALSSELLKGQASALELQLTNPTSCNLSEAFFGHLESVESSIRSWAAKNAPAATSASWDGLITRDYQKNTIQARFSLNDARSTTITTSIDLASGSASILN